MRRFAGSAARFLYLSAGFLILAAPVWAASPEESAASPTGWIYRWLNFLIFFGAIAYVFYKVTPAYFRHRREAIGEAIAESAHAKERAEKQSREAEAKLAALDKEVEEMRAQAKRESAGESERIRALAQVEAKRIEQAGLLEVAAAERAAQIELQDLAAQLAIEQAEELLRQRMTPGAEKRLFADFVTELSGSVN